MQDWIEEMSTFLKTIDSKHLLTVGLEGFYGPKSPKRFTENPELWASELGTDFIRNSMIPTIDFASVHIYPDHWQVFIFFDSLKSHQRTVDCQINKQLKQSREMQS